MGNVSGIICRGNQNTHFMFSNIFWKSCPLWDHVGKHGRAIQATNDNVAHPYCMLDKQSYRRILRICNTFCFLRQ